VECLLRHTFAAEPAQSPPPNLHQIGCARLWKCVVDQFTHDNLANAAPALDAAINARQAIVFRDGSDEVPCDAMKQFIATTAAALAKARGLLKVRPDPQKGRLVPAS
jgi:hypothetical protein